MTHAHLASPSSENRHSALKVVKSAGRYAETARDEIKLLRQVMAANPTHVGRNHIVSFFDSFTHSPLHHPSPAYGSVSQSSATSPDVHICIVFEPLGENLLTLVERHKTSGVPIPLVKIITKQVLQGLQYLHDECELVHTDIKPENISECTVRLPSNACRLLTFLTVISIPDVEGHIQAQLSTSPPPASRKVAVPPKTNGRAIPKRILSVNTALPKQTRQVHIFDSQPLASPSSSTSWSSKGLLAGLTRLKEAEAASSANGSANVSAVSSPLGFKGKAKSIESELDEHVKQGSGESDSSDVSSGPSSMAISCSVIASVDTPASSVGSLAGAFDKLMSDRKGKGKGKAMEVVGEKDKTGRSKVEQEIQEATCTCIFDWDAESGSVGGTVEGEGSEPGVPKSRLNPPSGPSLLSQTAPPDLHRHRPQCSTHSKSPTDVSAPLPDAKLSSALPTSPPTASLPDAPSSPSSSSSPTPCPSAPAPALPISIKIADLGNATPIRHHYTEDIQTRQYRAPEAITGRNDWGDTADVWSVACVVFELLTAEYLFDPQSQGELFGKDDDHCAQIIELLGPWPKDVLWGGRYSREIFDSNGEWWFPHLCALFSSRQPICLVFILLGCDACSVCGECPVPGVVAPTVGGRTWATDIS